MRLFFQFLDPSFVKFGLFVIGQCGGTDEMLGRFDTIKLSPTR